MRKLLFIFILVSIGFSFMAQVNLVPNPSFEQLDSCVAQFQSTFSWPYMQIQLASPWDTLKSGGGGNPLICNACFNPNPNTGVPKNFGNASGCTTVTGSYQIPKSGVGYLYFAYFKQSPPNVAWRAYAQVKLTQTLTTGEGYCVTYYSSLSNRATVAIDELSAYLDDGSLQSVAPMKEALATPQIKSPTGVFCTDTLNWIKVQGSFTATGNESYITLGNFRTPAATNYTTFCGPNGVAEYYVDDVSVIPLNLPAYAGPDQTILLGDSAYVGRPPEIGLECTWTTGTTTLGIGGGLWVKPVTTTTYIVTQDVCGNIKTDTVVINVSGVGINENTLFSNNINIYPQPAKDLVNISLNYFYEKSIEVKITDVNGRLVRNSDLVVLNGLAKLETSDLTDGVYILQLKNSRDQITVKRLVIAR